ncbi:MAG TPA: hypothetical protein DCO89_01170 [Clostridiales bacterium]|nr:hypothetical protein [Clostridiales bacterium]
METNIKQKETEMEIKTKEKEKADRLLLKLEIVIGIMGVLFLLGFVLIASYLEMAIWLKVGLIVFAFAVCLIAVCFAIKIEQVAGYYECGKCHHRYVPTYKQVCLSMHIGRTRYMKCPHCKEKSWNKKVISEKE